MKRAGHRGAAVAAMVLACAGAGAPPAVAQVPTPPPLPPVPYVTPPPETAPVFEFLAPTVYPQCGTAALVVFLAGSSAAPVAPTLLNVTTPVFAICGAVPVPEEPLTCLIDLQVQEVINTIGRQAGAALPLGLRPAGSLVEQAILIEDRLPPPAKDAGAGTLIAGFLVCSVVGGAPTTPGDFSSTPPPTFVPPPPSGSGLLPPNAEPGLIAQPPLPLPPAPAAGGQTARPVADAVTYAIVWLLPLALLFYGGYFGGALTRDIKLPAA